MTIRDDDGFSLVEVITAMAIASFALVVFYNALTDALARQHAVQKREYAAVHALFLTRNLALEQRAKVPSAVGSKAIWQHEIRPLTGRQSSHPSQMQHISISAHDPNGQTIFSIKTLGAQN